VVRCGSAESSGAGGLRRGPGVLLPSVYDASGSQAGWRRAERTGLLSDPGLLPLGEAAAEEADSEDHVVLPRVSGYQRSP